MTKEIHHQVTINAPPKAVFEALMDERKHAAFTGEPAKFSRKAGGTFRCYANYINGVNLVVTSPKLIVQAWRSRNWPKEHYSIVTFKFAKLPKGKTKLSFRQIGVPDWDYEEKNKGWKTHYWELLNAHFARK
jgi:activator of HSP90 ATPase